MKQDEHRIQSRLDSLFRRINDVANNSESPSEPGSKRKMVMFDEGFGGENTYGCTLFSSVEDAEWNQTVLEVFVSFPAPYGHEIF